MHIRGLLFCSVALVFGALACGGQTGGAGPSGGGSRGLGDASGGGSDGTASNILGPVSSAARLACPPYGVDDGQSCSVPDLICPTTVQTYDCVAGRSIEGATCACLNGTWTCAHSISACPALDSGPDSNSEPTPPPNLSASCDPRASLGPPWGDGGSGCTVGLACCRSADVDAGALYSQGIDPPYTCEAPGSAWVCQGPSSGSPCDAATAGNDPYFCARGLSCCTLTTGGPYTCMDPPTGALCSL